MKRTLHFAGIVIAAWLSCVCPMVTAAQSGGPVTDTAEEGDCDRLAEENRRLSRQVERNEAELRALYAEAAAPGIREIAGGIGYIAGVAGVAFYVMARRRLNQSVPGPERKNDAHL